MAFNWDRLQKSQRDYPKPKLAIAVANKTLKKQPANAYLLAWKLDLTLQLQLHEAITVHTLVDALRGMVAADTRLLSYVYRLLLESERRNNTGKIKTNTIGDDVFKAWEDAAKGMQSSRERLDLWNALFKAALREGCWEDVRAAVVRYNKEKPAGIKKHMYFLTILVTQLAAELNATVSAQASAPMQFVLAYRQLKQAYEKPMDDAVAIRDIKDLRFMADMFKRQDRLPELIALWNNPPAALEGVLSKHQSDLLNLKTRALAAQKKWGLLKDHCVACIEQTASQMESDPQRMQELCAWNWDVWKGLMDAIRHTGATPEAISMVSALMDRCFKPEQRIRDRALHLTYMKLQKFIGGSLIASCKDYWETHSRLPSCFKDLRPFVESLSNDDQFEFLNFIEERTFASRPDSTAEQKQVDIWLQAEFSVLKFTYLLTISQRDMPKPAAVESLIGNALRLYELWPENPEVGYLAVYGLQVLHHGIVRANDITRPGTSGEVFQVYNVRILLQATMLARHLVQRDADKSDRTGALLAARLHLNLGLGKSAFRLYSHAKLKEMLLDTLSPYILSRISITHPFEIKGYQGFSADAELSKVFSTIENMEAKLDSCVCTNIPSFAWDQAIDMLSLQQKLKSSYTKHLCVIERRRIARLTGESIEKIPHLEYRNYFNISNNVDRSVFPDFEVSENGEPINFQMPAGLPNENWFIFSSNDWDRISRVLYQEGNWRDFDGWHAKTVKSLLGPKLPEPNFALTELSVRKLWQSIKSLGIQLHIPGLRITEKPVDDVGIIIEEIGELRREMEHLCLPASTGLKPEDEAVMLHESMLASCYTKLEALRALQKLLNLVVEKVVKSKLTHPLKAKLPQDFVPSVTAEMLKCYEAIQDLAKSYISLIKKRGIVAIQAQIRWGPTGEMLKRLLSDDDVDFYAREYVDSMLEAWGGVLKVKLK